MDNCEAFKHNLLLIVTLLLFVIFITGTAAPISIGEPIIIPSG
jgi:hypothetical protein